VQREVTSQVERELKTRREAAEQSASIRDGKAGVVDFAIIFSQHHEAVGLLDRFPDAAVTRGNGNTFYTFVAHGKSVAGRNAPVNIVAAVPPDDSHAKLKLITNVVIDIFRPQRVVTAGFAAGIAPGVALLSLYVPNVLIDAAERRTIDLRQLQLAAPHDQSRDGNGADEVAADLRAAEDEANAISESFESLFRTGTIVTTRRPVYSVTQKQELRKTFAAQLADRSVFPILDVCQKRSMPVLPLRIVTSLYNEEFPREAKSSSGTTHPARRFGNLLGNFVRRPGSVIDTIKQKQRQLETADILAERIIKLLF